MKPHMKYQTFHCFHTRHVPQTYPVQYTHIAVHIYSVPPLIYQRVPSICCSGLNSQPSIVQQLHCSDAKLADHMSLNSFCAHWGKKKDALEHCNHAESTTEGKCVSGRCETQYSVYSVTTAFFFQLLLMLGQVTVCLHWFRACVPVLGLWVNWTGLDWIHFINPQREIYTSQKHTPYKIYNIYNLI